MRASATADALLRRAALAYLVAVGAFALAAAGLALRDHYTVPFVDDWRVLDRLDSLPLPAFLFTAQNGHYLPVTLALFAADQAWLGGRTHLLTVASLACLAIAGGLLARALRRHDGLASPLSRLALGFGVFALVWAASGHDLLWGLNQGTLQAVALAILAFSALGRVDPADLRGSRRALALAAAAALGASLSQSAGVAAWAGLVAAAVVLRLPGRAVAGLAALAAIVVAAIAASVPPHPNISFGDSLAFAREHPLALVRHALAFVGSAPARVLVGLGAGAPVPEGAESRGAWAAHTRDLLRLAMGAGGVGLAGFAALALARWRHPAARRTPDALSIGLMAFGSGAALLVAFARGAILGPASLVQTRFLTWSALFWVGAALALVPRRPGAGPHGAAQLAAVLMPVLSLAMLPALADARRLQANSRALASRLVVALQLGLRHDELAKNVSMHEVELVYRVAERLTHDGRWPFEPARRGLRGAALRERYADAGTCTGTTGPLRPLEGTQPAAAAVSGWLLPAAGAEPPRFVVLVDAAGAIRGLGAFEAASPRPGEELGLQRLWAGFVAEPDSTAPLTTHAVLADGRSSCRIVGASGSASPLDAATPR
jgi:hypothetical protein